METASIISNRLEPVGCLPAILSAGIPPYFCVPQISYVGRVRPARCTSFAGGYLTELPQDIEQIPKAWKHVILERLNHNINNIAWPDPTKGVICIMSKEPFRIIIAEDHTILREGLKALFSSDSDLKVVGEAKDGRAAIMCAETLAPDLFLMDLSMPQMNGLDAIKEIKKKSPQIKIIALTVHKTEEYVLATLQAGADGYVLKDAIHSELGMAIKNVLMGKRYLSPDISERVIEG